MSALSNQFKHINILGGKVMGREVRQRGNQPRPAEERVAEGFVPEEEVSVTETAKELGGEERRITVNEPGHNKNEVDVVVKHEVPVGVIIAFNVFSNPVEGPETIGRVTVKVNGDTFTCHGPELSSFSKKDEVIEWLGDHQYMNAVFPDGIVFEWSDIETGLE